MGTYNGVTNPAFTYDNDGNMLSGAGRTMSYMSFSQPSSIAQGTTSVGLAYDAYHQRYKTCVPNCTSPTATTYYMKDPMTGMYSERVVSGSTTTWNDYVIVPGAGIVAVRMKTGGTVLWRYAGVDHLGSVSTLTDTTTGVVERNSYDSWGKRRNADGSDNTTCSITSQVDRGFTGQEMLDNLCLVNMNARIYDPSLGRFMGADSILPDATSTQAHNRYSYVDDNPLAFTDPSGHETVIVYGPWSQLSNCTDDCSGDIGYHDTADALGFFDFGGDNGDADRGGGGDGRLHGHVAETSTFVNGIETLIEDWIPDDTPDTSADIADILYVSASKTSSKDSACSRKILQPTYTSIFGRMGKDLHVDPEFITSVALQESGWGLAHVFGTNSSSHGRPLNNLFGMTYAGGNNIAYPNLWASAQDWEADWGGYLGNQPQTIQDFTADLNSNPQHMYNSNPAWPGSVAARYAQIQDAVAKCGTTF